MAKTPKRPTRDEFAMEEIGNQISEAYQEKSDVVLTIWAWDEPLRGQIVKLDSRTGKVHVETQSETVKVPFMDIMQLGFPRN